MFHFTKAVLMVGGRIIASYFAWMRKFAKHPEKYPFEKRYFKLQHLLKKLNNGLSVTYHTQDVEKLPDETCLIVSNHLSAFDPLLLISAFDKPCTFVAKTELKNKPFAGKIIQGIDGLFIDRKDLKQSLRVMMKVEEDLKQRNKNWIIYPEGTRNKDQLHTVAEFHHGTFRPAVKAEVPIVPVAVYGTFRPLKESPQFKKYPVFIKVLDPIYPSEYKNMTTQELAKIVQDKIQRTISFELRKLDHQEMSGDKKYRFNDII